jgi:hypothetical protein
MGDGLLAEFASVVDAVECAIDIQRGMAERNSGEPEDQRVDLSRAALDRSRADDPYADRRLLLRHSESAALRQNGFQVASWVNFR